MFSGIAQVSNQVFQLFFRQFCVSCCASDYCGYKNGFRLLFASQIGHNVIRKEEKKV
jgi:hypothetical protein